MYLTHTKALLVKAMAQTFTVTYPNPDFRHLNVSIEYPIIKANYPSIWVDFEPVGTIRTVGIGHEEFTNTAGIFRKALRWSFAGSASFTALAMTSYERDRLYDEMIRTIAFGMIDPVATSFRTTIQNDPLVQLQPSFDEIDHRGPSAAAGTPWGSDEIMYEATIAIDCIGEFVSDASTASFIPLAHINTFQWATPIESDPTTNDGKGVWIGG